MIRLALLWLVAWGALEAWTEGYHRLAFISWLIISLAILTYPSKEDQ